MKSKREIFKEIYDVLNHVELLDHDCGMHCGAACCVKGGSYSEEDYAYESEENDIPEDDGTEA